MKIRMNINESMNIMNLYQVGKHMIMVFLAWVYLNITKPHLRVRRIMSQQLP